MKLFKDHNLHKGDLVISNIQYFIDKNGVGLILIEPSKYRNEDIEKDRLEVYFFKIKEVQSFHRNNLDKIDLS